MKRLVAFAALLALGGCEGGHAGTTALDSGFQASGLPGATAAEQRGGAYAQTNCAGCHSVGRSGESPRPPAPPLRSLGLRYPVEDLVEAFGEGIVTAHHAMPEFVLSPEENSDLIAYLKSIQSPATP